MNELTRDWLEVYYKAVARGDDFKASIWWRLAAMGELPLGVDTDHPEMIVALSDICLRIQGDS